MTVKEFLDLYRDYPCTEDQQSYCEYLERNGLRFLVDFGFENSEEKMWNLADPTGCRKTQ